MKTQKLTINGRVIDSQTSQGISNLRVEAWDKDLIFDDLVGSAVTDEQGRFSLSFTSGYFSEIFFDRRPDLFFKIFHQGRLIRSTEDSIVWNKTQAMPPSLLTPIMAQNTSYSILASAIWGNQP